MPNTAETKTIRDRLSAGECVFGPFLKMPALVPIDVVGQAGFDFAIIDLEHGPFTIERAEDMVRAAQGAGVASIIRTTDGAPSTLVRALDTGCDGVLVPNLENQQEAEAVVRGARFHPQGERGMDPYARSARYGTIPKEIYFDRANERTLLGVQIEGEAGVQNLNSILQVAGTDMIFVGPYDLSQSMGLPGQIAAPPVLEKIADIVQAAKARGKAVGIYADNVEHALRWRDLGVQFVAVSVDVRIFLEACLDMVGKLHN